MSITLDAIREREQKLLCHTYNRYPLAIARAQGCRLYGMDGREYVDMLAGIAVANVGHCRPELADIMAEQARRLVHVSNLFYQEEQLALAEKLLATCHADKVFLCNSGAEANEAAVKLARRTMRKARGRDAYEIVTLQSSFHGRTLAMVTATGQQRIKDGFEPLPPGFVTVPWGDLEAMGKAIGPHTAAVLVEVVQGEGGVRPMTPAYAQGLQALCRERDVLLMVDEIQTGLGRTGSLWGLRAFRAQARHLHLGQGPRQWPAHGRHAGHGRRRPGIRAGHPRHHLRRRRGPFGRGLQGAGHPARGAAP